jgi:hypothetical protein
VKGLRHLTLPLKDKSTMKTLIRCGQGTSCALLTALMSVMPVFPADAQPLTRAEVKAETKDASKHRELLPAGEASPAPKEVAPSSGKTRAQEKAETAAARASGDLLPAGERSTTPAERKAAASRRSQKTRAQQNAETRAAIKAGQTIPAGDGPATNR